MKTIRYDIVTLIIVIAMIQYACVASSPQRLAGKRLQEKDYQGAIDVYQTVVDSKPETPDARQAQLGIAKIYIENLDQPEQGIQIYQDLIATAHDSDEAAEAHWGLGLYAFKSEDYQSAQQSFDTIVNKFPTSERSYNAQLMLAKSYEEINEYRKAVEIYGNVANRHPEGRRATQALVNKARIQEERLRDETAAKRTYQSIVKRYGNVEGTEESVSAARQELRMMGAIIPEPDDQSLTPLERALERQRQRRERDRPRGGVERSPAMGAAPDYSTSGFDVDPEEIMRPFKTIINEMSGEGTEGAVYHDTVLKIAHLNWDTENYRNAGALYFHAIGLAERQEAHIDPHSYLRLSLCYRKLGMHQHASEMVKKAVKKDGQVLDAIISSAANQYIDEDYEKAIETYSSVLGLNRAKDPEIYWRIGLAYKKMNDPHQAIESFERAIAVKTEHTKALQSLAELLHYQLKHTDRAAIFQDLVDQKGETYAGEIELATLCYKYGNYGWAKSKYEFAARIAQKEKTDDTTPFQMRGIDNRVVYAKIHAAMAAYKGEMSDKAQEIIDTLTSEHPNHPLIPYGQGQLAALGGNMDTAITAFKTSIEQDPSFYAAPIALGEYYLSQGYTEEAVALWKKSLRANPLNRVVRHRLHELTKRVGYRFEDAEKSRKMPQGEIAAPTTSSQKSVSAASNAPRSRELPAKRRTIYPKRRIPKSQLPSALFVGLSEDQITDTHGQPTQILSAVASIPNSTKRLAYGDPIHDAIDVATLEGSEFILGEEGVLGFRKVYSGDINAVAGSPVEYPTLVSEIPQALNSTVCHVINEEIIDTNKYFLIVQKAQIVWQLDSERWIATAYTTYPAEDRKSERSINKYKPKLKDYRIMELLVTARDLPLNISLK
ncbi:tetratricopeptide repeat protein [Candidatus Poribacteria bacterium]|nr:tetratricopeptide repeat protein [Candidatus Poribacteria bacterium]